MKMDTINGTLFQQCLILAGIANLLDLAGSIYNVEKVLLVDCTPYFKHHAHPWEYDAPYAPPTARVCIRSIYEHDLEVY